MNVRFFSIGIDRRIREGQRVATALNLRDIFNLIFSKIQQEKVKTDDPYGVVARGLESCYKKVLLPFEEKCNFHQFHYAKYDDCEFESKPFVMLIGIKK